MPSAKEFKELKETTDKIGSRLDAVETALSLRPPPKNWFAARWEWIINNKGTSLILAIILCLLTYYLNHKDQYFNSGVDSRIRTELEKPNGVTSKLDNIQSTVTKTAATVETLTPFIHDLVTREFEKTAALPNSELQRGLPFLKETIAVARNQNIPVDHKIADALGNKLATLDPNAPDLWPASLEFISYRSQLAATNQENPIYSNLPNCTDKEPSNMVVTGVYPEANQLTLQNATYADCQVTLDSPKDTEKLNDILQHRATRISFNHCLIIYNGGRINVILDFHHVHRFVKGYTDGKQTLSTEAYVDGPTLEFDDCLFIFTPGSARPSDSDLKFAQDILQQSGSKFIVPMAPPPS